MTPQQPLDPDEAVRRLLADARHDAPVPEDVVRRLDATLADLVAERSAETIGTDKPGLTDAPVVDLAARRRRRLGGAVLAAASVAVVAGLALPQVLPRPVDNDTAGSASAGSAEESSTPAPAAKSETLSESFSGDVPDTDDPTTETMPRAMPGPVELSSQDLDATTLALLGTGGQPMATFSVDLGACSQVARSRDEVLPVVFDGAEALAVWLPRQEPTRVVVRRCADGVRLWSAPLR